MWNPDRSPEVSRANTDAERDPAECSEGQVAATPNQEDVALNRAMAATAALGAMLRSLEQPPEREPEA